MSAAIRRPRVSGLVLAGGGSRRMGRDKAFLELWGKTFVKRVLEALGPVCDELVIAVAPGDTGRFLELHGRGLKLVEDSVSGRGPIEGLRAGLSAARGALVAVAPVDAPLVTGELYAFLLGLAKGHDAVVPFPEGMAEPLLAVWRRLPALRAIDNVIASGGRRPAEALGMLRLRRVHRSELSAFLGHPGPFTNLNTPSDMRAVEKAMEGNAAAVRASWA